MFCSSAYDGAAVGLAVAATSPLALAAGAADDGAAVAAGVAVAEGVGAHAARNAAPVARAAPAMNRLRLMVAFAMSSWYWRRASSTMLSFGRRMARDAYEPGQGCRSVISWSGPAWSP